MGNYEQSNTEGYTGNKSTKTRIGIYNTIAASMKAEESKRESDIRKKERVEQFGRDSEGISEKRNEGINDRVNSIQFDANRYEDKYEQNNYHEGFFVMGNRVIHGMLEELSDEQLQAIAANDYVSGVDLNTLPEAIKNNVSYVEGYMMATIFGNESKKGRR